MIDIGSAVGNYVVRSKLGEGGMGIVFLAEHPLIGRRVAIKVIHPNYARNPEAVSRFFTEAQAVNTIGHPNIVDITDFGQTPEGESYFVMEFLSGESLFARLHRERLPEHTSLRIGAQVADALAASHANGILHRDLKPDNIFLVPRGSNKEFVKVLDFGLAKLTSSEKTSSHKTRTGSMMGTPYYMSPEQCSGKADIDARADVYAVGVILFEMVTGQVPFSGEGYGEIIVKHMTVPAPHVRELAPDTPDWLDELIHRCMEKDRTRRVQTMAELQSTIQSVVGDGSLPSRVAGPGQRGDQTGPVRLAPASQPGVARPLTPPPTHIQSPSTLSGSAGQVDDASLDVPPTNRRGLMIGAGVAILVAGIVTAILFLGDDKKPTTAAAGTEPSANVVPDKPPEKIPEKTPVAPPDAGSAMQQATAGEVLIEIESDPPGATVALTDGTPLGITPTTWRTAPSSKPLELVFTKTGYQPKKRTVTPKKSQAIEVALSPARTSRTPRDPKDPKQPKGDSDLIKPTF